MWLVRVGYSAIAGLVVGCFVRGALRTSGKEPHPRPLSTSGEGWLMSSLSLRRLWRIALMQGFQMFWFGRGALPLLVAEVCWLSSEIWFIEDGRVSCHGF